MIQDHLRKGLRGIKNVDRHRVHCSNTRRLRGSVDLDGALRLSHPNDPRWDYAIGITANLGSEVVIWLEVHPASSRHVDEVLRKLQWLRNWLTDSAPTLKGLRGHFHWVATGTVAFRRGSREEKRIAEKGLRFPVKQLDLDRVQ